MSENYISNMNEKQPTLNSPLNSPLTHSLIPSPSHDSMTLGHVRSFSTGSRHSHSESFDNIIEHSHSHSHAHGHTHASQRGPGLSSHAHAHSAHNHSHHVNTSSSFPLCHGFTNQSRLKEAESNRIARCKLWSAAILCGVFMIVEFIGGYLANSLAVQTDAAHLLSDLASFMISIAALSLASTPPTKQLSFGSHRYEVVGALISVVMIWILTFWLGYQAVLRVLTPEDVDGQLMFMIAGGGLGINILMGLILAWSGHGHSHGTLGDTCDHGHASHDHGHDHDISPQEHGHSHSPHSHSFGQHSSPRSHSDHTFGTSNSAYGRLSESFRSTAAPERNINVTAALIHVIGDALQSVGVMIAAGLIWYQRLKSSNLPNPQTKRVKLTSLHITHPAVYTS